MGNFRTHVDSQQVFLLGFCPCRSADWISGNNSACRWNHAGVWRRTLKCWHLLFALKTESWWVRSEESFVISCLMADQNAINFQNYSFHLNALPKLKLSKGLRIFPFNITDTPIYSVYAQQQRNVRVGLYIGKQDCSIPFLSVLEILFAT